MIHVSRSRMPKPDFWDSPGFQKFLVAWSHFHGEEGGTRATQRRAPHARDLERFRELALELLLKAFHGKCAYTEQRITAEEATVVFHRPEADAVGLESEVSPAHYWWAVGEWSNWYPASRAVLLSKGTRFPVAGDRSPLPRRGKKPSKRWLAKHRDRGLLLDPGFDHPGWYLEFRHDGVVAPRHHPSPGVRSRADGHSRGEITIKALDLNNRRLREGRAAAIKGVPPAVQGDFSTEINSRAEYAGAVRQAAARRLLKLLSGFSSLFVSQIRHFAEELAAEIAYRGVPWTQGSAPGPPETWAPVRETLAREWPELSDEDWARMIAGGTGDGTSAVSFAVEGTGKGTRDLPAAGTGTGTGTASDLESARVVERSARIASIKIRNFKAIEVLELELATEGVQILPRYGTAEKTLPAAGWTAFLGENGSGKSCCLQAVGLALAGDRLGNLVKDAKLEWRKLLRRGTRQGRVLLRFTGGTTVDLRFNANKHWWVGGAPRMAAFVRGYGATRLLEGKIPGTGDGSNIRLANLFDPRAPVIDAERWLLGLEDEGDFNTAGLAVSGFLGAGEPVQGTLRRDPDPPPFITRDREDGEVLAGGDPLSYASDGYRAVVALVCDVIAGLAVGLSDVRNATGIVLIDEIGAHLHPRWKMEITSRLRREFPQLQFLVSTHEPLCLRGLFAREVIRVRKLLPERTAEERPAAGKVDIELIERSPSDYRIDQLLTSEFFGLDTTIDPDLDRRFQAYYRLLAMTPEERSAKLPHDPSRTLEEEMRRLRDELKRLTRPVLGYTRRDQLVHDAIDQFLMDDAGASFDSSRRRQRRQQTLDKIKDIWTPPEILRRMAGKK